MRVRTYVYMCIFYINTQTYVIHRDVGGRDDQDLPHSLAGEVVDDGGRGDGLAGAGGTLWFGGWMGMWEFLLTYNTRYVFDQNKSRGEGTNARTWMSDNGFWRTDFAACSWEWFSSGNPGTE